VVDEQRLLGPDRVRPGDAVVAVASTGLHSNGYSLVRHVFFDRRRWTVDRWVDDLGRTLGEELLEPTRVYTRDCLALAAAVGLHAIAHITGGGIPANLSRVLPPDLDAAVDRSTWAPQPIFGLVGSLGDVGQLELERAFNMGIGMIAIVAAADADRAVRVLSERGLAAWIAGTVTPGSGAARLHGAYQS
jgi:phosphoribosylformylglycinamidine cyclo-ligase